MSSKSPSTEQFIRAYLIWWAILVSRLVSSMCRNPLGAASQC